MNESTTPTVSPTPDRSPNVLKNLGDIQVVETLSRVPATREREFQIVVVKAVPGTSSANMYVCLADAEATSGYAWNSIVGGALKTASGGYFLIPAGPTTGTTVASGTANAYGLWVEMDAVVSADIYVVGVLQSAEVANRNYIQIGIGVGAFPSEVSVGEVKYGKHETGSGYMFQPLMFPFPVPIASGVRLSLRTADSSTAVSWILTLICINQADLVGI